MKRHGRLHVLEPEPAAGGHIIRARLTRGDGPRTGRLRPRQPARIGSYNVARPAHGRRRGRPAAHDAPRDLRDGRAPAAARRHPHPPARAAARRRFARLAGPEARAIAKGVTGDERHNPSVSKGGWEVDIRVVCRTGRGSRGSAKAPDVVTIRRPALGRGSRTRAVRATDAARQDQRHRRRCPPYERSRRDSSTATRGRIGRSRAGSPARSAMLRVHLLPALVKRKLDAIKSEDVQRLKARCRRSPRRRSTTSWRC